ncbi:astacin [Cooperia oncophora]
MAYIAGHTCIDFREDPTATNRLRIVKLDRDAKASSSECGMQGGVQELSMVPDCPVGDVIHELIHSLGVEHMQNRYDRDNYVKVNLSSSEKADDKYQFEKMQADNSINYTPYEYGSIMHYSAEWNDGTIVMTPVDSLYMRTMGSPIPSFYDMMMLNMHYKCNGILTFIRGFSSSP